MRASSISHERDLHLAKARQGDDLILMPRVLALIAPLMPPVSAPAIGTGNASRARPGSFYAVGDLSPATLRNLRVDRVEEGRLWGGGRNFGGGLTICELRKLDPHR